MNTIFINCIIYVLFPLFVLGKCRIDFKVHKKELISQEDSLYLRGIAAFFVVFAHLLSEIVSDGCVSIGIAYPMVWFGGLGVCIFFFLSGYGLWCAYGQKQLETSFLVKRVLRIIPTFVILRLVTGWVLIPELAIDDIIQYLLFLLGIISPMWFVVEILLIYFAFFLIGKFTVRYRIVCMFFFLLLMSGACFFLGLEERWYNANMLFAVGMLIAEYRVWVQDRLQRKPIIWLMVFAFLFLAFSACFVFTKGMLISATFKIAAGTFLCMMFVVLTLFIYWQGKLIKYMGCNSFELYLIHQNIWLIIMRLNWEPSITLLCAIILSVGFGYIGL